MQIKLKRNEIPEYLKQYFKPSRGCGACYVCHLVQTCQEIKRILHPTGLFFLNLGDSYSNDTKWGGQSGNKNYTSTNGDYQGQRVKRQTGLPPKSKMMIPARVAIALQEDGWILRQEMVWLKTNPMPESVGDRPGVAHEYIFMFAKSERYFWDMEAVRRELSQESVGRAEHKQNLIDREGIGTLGKQVENGVNSDNGYAGLALGHNGKTDYNLEGRNYRTTDPWLTSLEVAIAQNRQLAQDAQAYADYLETMRDAGGLVTDPDGEPLALWTSLKGFSGLHYATFPVALVLDLIRASTSEAGVCPSCLKQYKRVIEKTGEMMQQHWAPGTQEKASIAQGRHGKTSILNTGFIEKTKTIRWQPSCSCPQLPPTPAIICDPFAGSGTVGEACRKLGNRHFIGIDLSAQYLAKNASARSEQATTEAGLEDVRQKRPKIDKKVAQAKKAGQLSF